MSRAEPTDVLIVQHRPHQVPYALGYGTGDSRTALPVQAGRT
ncbi:hypothetical protein [Streptomyces zaehneri]|nr:hypothetical protein [Streptomyces sp. DSM 40713]